MAWIERVDRRTRRSKTWQNDSNPAKFSLDTSGPTLHYESVIDNGDYDTPVDCTPVRVDVPSFDGWRITENGWHYALGKDLANHGSEDGWVGFGGRGGQHWFKFRLLRIGYLHWPARGWTDLGGSPNYNRARLTRETLGFALDTDGIDLPIASTANWGRIWTTPGGGEVSVNWEARGDGLKENVVLNQAGREWLVANMPPTTPINETYFGFVFRLDWSDVPRVYRQGVLQDVEGDFADDDESIELRDDLDRLLAFMPISEVRVKIADEPLGSAPLRKRFWKDGDGNHYLLVGARVDILNGMAAGDLIFDPTVDEIVTASNDDMRETGTGGVDSSANSRLNASFPYAGYIWDAVAIDGGVTIDECYMQIYGDHPSLIEFTGDWDFVAEDDCAAWSTGSGTYDVSGRTLTGNAIGIDITLSTSAYTTTSSNVAALQAIVDRGGWSSGQDMGVVVAHTGADNAQYSTYDDASAEAPKLHIEYTEGGATIAVNQVTETNVSQAIARLKAKTAAQVTESDLSQVIARLKTAAVNLVAETPAGQSNFGGGFGSED